MDEKIDSQTTEQQDTRNCHALGFGHLQFPDDRSWDTQNHDINDDSRNTIDKEKLRDVDTCPFSRGIGVLLPEIWRWATCGGNGDNDRDEVAKDDGYGEI